MSVRNLQPFVYWLEQINFIDRIRIQSYVHEKAHEIARKFFMEHTEYTHFLFLNDDILISPDMVKLLIRDDEENNFPIISGYCNWDWRKGWTNATLNNLRKTRIGFAEQYGFINIKDIFSGKFKFPFQPVYFEGLCGTLIKRDIIDKIPFRPYKYYTPPRTLRVFKDYVSIGIMFDLQFANDCYDAGLDIMLDLRCFFVHGGDTDGLYCVDTIPKSVTFYGKDGTVNVLEGY